MGSFYKIKLAGRGSEAVEYRDEHDVYRFGLKFVNGVWIVLLPGTKGPQFASCDLSDSEQDVVLSRIRQYLEQKRDFIVFGPTHRVAFEREVISAEMAERRRVAAEYLRKRAQ